MLRMKVRAGDRVLVGEVEVICMKRVDDPDMMLSIVAPDPVTTTEEGDRIVIRSGEVSITRTRGVMGENISLAIDAPASVRIFRESDMPAKIA